MNDIVETDPRLHAIPDIHGHAKGEHKAFTDERPIPLSARMLFLWFYHACRRGWPRFLMVTDHMNYLTFEDPAAINLVRRALKLAQAGDLYGAAETASVEVGHAAVVSEGLRRGMRYSIGAEVDNDPRSRPDAQNIVDAMKPDGMIRSVHFLTIDHPTHGPNWNWPFDNPEFADVYEIVGTQKTWELYTATLFDAIERLPGNIVGHFYVPALFGHWPDDATLEGYENALVDLCEARGMAIEFNTRFLYREHSDEQKANYLRAHRRLLAKCKAKNVGIAVGSDAHSPKDQGGAFTTVLALLDECEINELVFPLAGRLARVALRVERKVEATPEPIAPPPEERRPARKVRPAEAPARDELPAPVPVASIAAEPPKPRVRPKRSKVAVAAREPAPDGAGGDAGDVFVSGTAAAAALLEPHGATVAPDSPIEADPSLDGAGRPAGADSNDQTDSLDEAHSHAKTDSHGEAHSHAGTDSHDEAYSHAGTDSHGEAHSHAVTDSLDEADSHAVTDSPAPSDGLIPGESVAVGDSLVSSALEDIVSEAQLEPLVSAPEAPALVLDGDDTDAGDASDELSDPFVAAQDDTVSNVVESPPGGPEPAAGGPEPSAGQPELAPDAGGPSVAADEAAAVRRSRPAPKAKNVRERAVSTKSKTPPKNTPKATVKSASAKSSVKKALPKKVAAPKPPPKVAAPKKASAKKAAPKKAAVRATAVKKTAAKKGAAKKAAPKKPAQRRR